MVFEERVRMQFGDEVTRRQRVWTEQRAALHARWWVDSRQRQKRRWDIEQIHSIVEEIPKFEFKKIEPQNSDVVAKRVVVQYAPEDTFFTNFTVTR